MYLKKIIAQGFKSFADNTIIDLENNIAGIVGPNGSGKSNVVDAIRWVLGEQSVKSLRGEESMTDVIFSGSKSRNAMNSATVTLLFNNSDNYLNIAFDEVEIKRRLYKDGTNEFFLNGEKCRLKDINDLLMDSGIAKESFNIISQGKIDDILSSKPESRRIAFEEAAGVLKYKKRKVEALKKLDKTHDNMSRINDIISELETQIEPLREQKIKAIEYLDLNDELRELEISLITHDITEINSKYQSDKDKIDNLNKEILTLNVSTNTNEAKTSKYKSEISNIELEIKNYSKQLLEVTANIERVNARKQSIIERKKYKVDDIKLHNNLVKLHEDELKTKNDINACENEINVKNNELNHLLEAKDNIESDIIRFKSNKQDCIDNLNKTIRNISNKNIKIASLKDSIDNNSSLPYAVKSVIENPKLRGIHSVIGSLIETDEKYSKAISVVLGANSSTIVVDDEICAKEAINYLKNNNLGRVTFFPLNTIKPKFIDSETLKLLSSFSGFIDIASSLVKYDSKYENIIKNQLGNVIVVDNIDTANSISKKIAYKYRIITIAGEIIHVGGALTGGTLKTRNIITDKYELENELKEVSKLEGIEKELENKINEIDHNLKALEDKLYLNTREKISIDDYIELKRKSIAELNGKLEEITNEIKGIDITLNNSLDEEENLVIKEYYKVLDEKENIESNLQILNNNKTKLNNELDEFEHIIKKDNSLYNEKVELLHSLEIEVNRADVKLDNLLSSLNENYSMTYEKAISLYKLNIEPNIARNKVNTLKRKIKELGPVNTAAPEEYERISARYEFLINQQQDLSKAEATLLEIIDEMDSVMKQEFLKTFKIISANFETTFKELFKGGHASLSLTDPNNLLETGIEIDACPPGKTLKSINLLSGGERTFTAISLLFAILKSRPVPFCILDEVEAALDEVNVESFGEYIKKLKDKTQFIIITHKKKTMEFVDILYGITMQESGVSKLVSVKLEELK